MRPSGRSSSSDACLPVLNLITPGCPGFATASTKLRAWLFSHTTPLLQLYAAGMLPSPGLCRKVTSLTYCLDRVTLQQVTSWGWMIIHDFHKVWAGLTGLFLHEV